MGDEKDAAFLAWLEKEGARFPSIEWPSDKTESGIRGAVAKEDIETNQNMIEIPKHLIISPPIVYADKDIGSILEECADVIYGDLIPAVYLMHEKIKGKDSFYYPFIQILPNPGNVSEWTDDELSWLQDDKMIILAKRRRLQIKHVYRKCIGSLYERYPDIFPIDKYTEELFSFAWNSVQARAFGRRLPW